MAPSRTELPEELHAVFTWLDGQELGQLTTWPEGEAKRMAAEQAKLARDFDYYEVTTARFMALRKWLRNLPYNELQTIFFGDKSKYAKHKFQNVRGSLLGRKTRKS